MDHRHRGRLLAALVAPLALLVACGGAPATAAPPEPSATAVATAPATASATSVSAPSPAPVAAVRAATQTQPMAASATVFPIRPLVPGGPSGMVTVTHAGGGARLRIVVHGLAPGSPHAIHDHLGVCGEANVSDHLRVLGVPVADATGTAIVDTVVPAFDAGTARIVIVYASAVAAVITGCAGIG